MRYTEKRSALWLGERKEVESDPDKRGTDSKSWTTPALRKRA
jgi:hypothetical protein